VTARRLATSPIPHRGHSFEIDFDFIDHHLVIKSADGSKRTIPLQPITVADFYHQLMSALAEMDLPVQISGTSNEVEQAAPFVEDRQHASYDPEYATRFWRVLCRATASLAFFAASSSANAARCISSGAALISR
jgi:hypothetical protein